MENNSPYLIVGLGNPGKKYSMTRHNIGAFVVESFARELGVSMKAYTKFDGFVCSTILEEKKVIFLIPTTYMNLSGTAVKKCIDYYNVSLDKVLILSDDTYIPFSDVRFKMGGSAGGHNGLKNIEYCLGTNKYSRLRIGIGEKQTEDLADYVLQRFTKEEESKMNDITDKCIQEVKVKFLATSEKKKIDKQKEDLRSN